MATLQHWVWLSALELRPAVKYALWSRLDGPERVYTADEKELSAAFNLTDGDRQALSHKSLAGADEILELCRQRDIGIVTIADSAYPQRLKSISDPPLVLYVRGRLPAVDALAAVAVVGTRRATPYGLKMARQLGFEITKCGGTVVTGLAAGVDTAAAEGALRAGGSCVGVLGCAIDQVFPSWNGPMYDDVAAVGALLSEYPPNTPGAPHRFPERNRIMSGLTLGSVIVEAPLRSGALITAALALEQGREVFALPGSVDAPNSAGANRLIREGATLVTNGWDIMQEFAPLFPDKLRQPTPEELDMKHVRSGDKMPPEEKDPKKTPEEKSSGATQPGRGFARVRQARDAKPVDKKKPGEYSDLREQLKTLTGTQLQIVSAMDEREKHVDDIIEATGLPPSTVLSELTILQIKGFVSQENGKRFTLNISKQ